MDDLITHEQEEQTKTMQNSQDPTAPPIRWTQVLEIQAALEAGTYNINYDQLAEKMSSPNPDQH